MMNQNTSEKRGALRFFSICLAVLLLSSVLIWGFQTSWGNIAVRRLTLTGADGTKLSTLIYIPNTATTDNPAPCAVIYHGRSNQGHSNDTWSLELARRGYVVLSPDLSGGGESDVVDRNMQGILVAKYALSLDIVDPAQLNVIGYSLGTSTAVAVASAMPKQINTCLNVMGPFMLTISKSMDKVVSLLKDSDIDVGIVKADCDQYDFNFLGDAKACREKVSKALGLSTTIEANTDTKFGATSILRYTEVTGSMHQTGNISASTINAIITFENDLNNEPVKLDNADQTWIWQQIFSGVACVDMMFLLAAVLNLLMQTEFFGSIACKRSLRKEQKGAKAWVLDILFTFVIPVILFIPVSTWGMSWFANSAILTSSNLNGIMLWLVAIALIGVIRTIIKNQRRKKAGEKIALSDFCIAEEGESKLKWSRVGKSLLLGIGVTCFFGLVMTAMEGYLGIDYQVWNLSTYLKPSPERVLRAIPYMLIIFAVMFLGNMNQRTLPSTGNEHRDMVKAVTVNTILTALALFTLLLIQYGGSFLYGTGETFFKQNGGSTGALDFAFGYCYMMGGSTGVVTYIYRKYGNIWAGVIPASIFAGLFTTLAFTLVR